MPSSSAHAPGEAAKQTLRVPLEPLAAARSCTFDHSDRYAAPANRCIRRLDTSRHWQASSPSSFGIGRAVCGIGASELAPSFANCPNEQRIRSIDDGDARRAEVAAAVASETEAVTVADAAAAGKLASRS